MLTCVQRRLISMVISLLRLVSLLVPTSLLEPKITMLTFQQDNVLKYALKFLIYMQETIPEVVYQNAPLELLLTITQEDVSHNAH